jgi:hypothetical protein
MNTVLRHKTPHHITVDEFIAWAPDDRWELIDGSPRAVAPASATHGMIQANCLHTHAAPARRRQLVPCGHRTRYRSPRPLPQQHARA